MTTIDEIWAVDISPYGDDYGVLHMNPIVRVLVVCLFMI